jgi:hypothetical protein
MEEGGYVLYDFSFPLPRILWGSLCLSLDSYPGCCWIGQGGRLVQLSGLTLVSEEAPV